MKEIIGGVVLGFLLIFLFIGGMYYQASFPNVIFSSKGYNNITNSITTVKDLNIINNSYPFDSYPKNFLYNRTWDTLLLDDSSESMKPTLDNDDIVILVKDFSSDELFLMGNIIAFKYNDRLIVHRIIRIEEDGSRRIIHTKGDNNLFEDYIKVYQGDVLGVVVGVLYR